MSNGSAESVSASSQQAEPARPGLAKGGEFSGTFCLRASTLSSESSEHNNRRSYVMPPEAKPVNTDKMISVKLPFEVVKNKIPPDMLERLKRDFTDAEVEQIYARCGRTLAPKMSLPQRPAVLFVLGPSAVGKSYITDASSSQLFGSAHNAVILDGEFFREWHAGWCEVRAGRGGGLGAARSRRARDAHPWPCGRPLTRPADSRHRWCYTG